jgi:nucleotide-binding universal stress UspA family protein
MDIVDEPLHSPVTFRHILFAMDFSAGSLRALPFAIGIARQYDAKLFVAHVTPSEDENMALTSAEAALDKIFQAAAEAGLNDAAGHLAHIPHEVLFQRGDISNRLLATADSCKIDLIVIGTHGWRGIKKLLKGSTAEEIACLASRPVLIVGPRVSTQANFQLILYTTDLLPPAMHALPYAVSMAQAYNSDLLVLHVNDWNSGERPADAEPNTSTLVRRHLARYSGNATTKMGQVIVDFGPRADLILEHASGRGADLIVMGLHSRDAVQARIAAHLPGSITYEVFSRASCPVLAVPLPRKTVRAA